MGVLYEIVRHANERPERSSAAERQEQAGIADQQPTVGEVERTKSADAAAELLQLSYRSAELELKRQEGRASGWLRLYRKPDA